MRLKPLFFANVMALTFACTTAAPRPQAGFYGGGFGIPPDFLYTQIELETNADGSLKGTLWQPYERVGSFPLGSIPVDGPRLRRGRSEEHTSELQSQSNLVCRLLLEKKK